jgi:hypothetical protein
MILGLKGRNLSTQGDSPGTNQECELSSMSVREAYKTKVPKELEHLLKHFPRALRYLPCQELTFLLNKCEINLIWTLVVSFYSFTAYIYTIEHP